MFSAQLIGFAGWMQRITEKYQTREIVYTGGCDLRSDAPAHGLAANYQTIRFQRPVFACSLDNGAIAGLEFCLGIGCAPPLLTVEKVEGDRKSTRLNSSHGYISYAVFCLK